MRSFCRVAGVMILKLTIADKQVAVMGIYITISSTVSINATILEAYVIYEFVNLAFNLTFFSYLILLQ